MKSKKAVRKAWVEALRSGKYKQDTHQLKTKKGFCCLGVLCEVAKKNGVIMKYTGTHGHLPLKVQKWVGLSTAGGGFLNGSLIRLNDKQNASFETIALFIESQPEGLFVD